MLSHKGTQEIITDRLILRKYSISDDVYMYKNYATDPRVTKFLTWQPYKNIEDVRKFICDIVETYTHNNIYNWAIQFNSETIGSISITSLDENNHCCEIGYCIGYDYWNKGIVTEAMSAVINFLFTEVGMHRVMAKHDIQNPASGKAMLKCNMVYEGKFSGFYYRQDGIYSDALIYGILNN